MLEFCFRATNAGKAANYTDPAQSYRFNYLSAVEEDGLERVSIMSHSLSRPLTLYMSYIFVEGFAFFDVPEFQLPIHPLKYRRYITSP